MRRIIVLMVLVLAACGTGIPVKTGPEPSVTAVMSSRAFPTFEGLNDAVRQVQVAQWNDVVKWNAATHVVPPVSRPKPKPAPTTVDGSTVWDRIAQCESGGNWHINTGNGYYGGLQMDMTFWHSYGGDEFASRPDLASREEQIIVAEKARDSGRGYAPWPVCGRRA